MLIKSKIILNVSNLQHIGDSDKCYCDIAVNYVSEMNFKKTDMKFKYFIKVENL